jgi:hypothetical protein
VREDNRFAVGQVRGNDGHGNSKVFKAARFENLLDEVAEPAVVGEPQPGDLPPGDVAKTKSAASGNDAGERSSTCVRGAENAAHARACNTRDRYVILFENLQNAKMREATRKPAAQSQAQTRSFGRGRRPSVH